MWEILFEKKAINFEDFSWPFSFFWKNENYYKQSVKEKLYRGAFSLGRGGGEFLSPGARGKKRFCWFIWFDNYCLPLIRVLPLLSTRRYIIVHICIVIYFMRQVLYTTINSKYLMHKMIYSFLRKKSTVNALTFYLFLFILYKIVYFNLFQWQILFH